MTEKELSPLSTYSNEASIDSAISMPSLCSTAQDTLSDDEDDWQGSKSVIESNRHMLLQQLDCDITFICGESKDYIGAHKYVLTSRSNVFHAMFHGRLAETENTITIPDIELNIFMAMLKYDVFSLIYVEQIKKI